MPKVLITETVLRDAHQSLAATRMTTEEMIPVLAEAAKSIRTAAERMIDHGQQGKRIHKADSYSF